MVAPKLIYPMKIEYISIPHLRLEVPKHISNDRNWQFFMSNIVPDEESGCWLWGGHLDVDGYGKWCRRVDGRTHYYRAHRYSYERLIGQIPEGLCLDHLCRQRNCVNPEHLEPVTSSENSRRGVAGVMAKERAKKIKHCPHGHPYEGWNLILYQGRRFCRECMYARNYERKEKIRVAKNG